LSAVTHASWNAARSRHDPGAAVTATVFMAGVISVPFTIWLGLPPLDAVPWLLAGIIFNTATLRILVATYRMMPFAMAYPLTRGTIPLAVTASSILFERMACQGQLGFIGITMVSVGVILLSFSGQRQEQIGWKPIALAILGGVTAAIYVLTDVKGIAITGSPVVYGLMAAIINAIAMPLLLRLEGVPFNQILRGQLQFGFFASLFSMGSYLLFLYALTHGPIGAASAIRETSAPLRLDAFNLHAEGTRRSNTLDCMLFRICRRCNFTLGLINAFQATLQQLLRYNRPSGQRVHNSIAWVHNTKHTNDFLRLITQRAAIIDEPIGKTIYFPSRYKSARLRWFLRVREDQSHLFVFRDRRKKTDAIEIFNSLEIIKQMGLAAYNQLSMIGFSCPACKTGGNQSGRQRIELFLSFRFCGFNLAAQIGNCFTANAIGKII